MSEANPTLDGDDFVQGVLIARIAPNGMLLGHAQGEPGIFAAGDIARWPDRLTGERWDQADIDGSLEARDCTITYRRGGQKLVVAVVRWDLEGLRAEVEFERTMAIGRTAAKTSP